MDVLVLGGSGFLSRAVAEAAVAVGHAVTCAHRGTSEPAEGAHFVRLDRSSGTGWDEVADRRWDAVVDVARDPAWVRRAGGHLVDVGRYVFVSSVNVYAETGSRGQDEQTPLLPALPAGVAFDAARYGEAKVACEQAVLDAHGPDRSVLVRPGLIGGPGDPSGRASYWVRRFAAPGTVDGAVLVPDAAGQPFQMIDVRDLATWIVHLAGTGDGQGIGAFTACGDRSSVGEWWDAARAVAGHVGPARRAGAAWLSEHDVHPWSGPRSLPWWLPDPADHGFADHRNDRAVAAGLQRRPLGQTLLDTLTASLASSLGLGEGAGLTDAEQRDLLDRLG